MTIDAALATRIRHPVAHPTPWRVYLPPSNEAWGNTERAAAITAALGIAGVGAAIGTGDGRLAATNARFVRSLGDRIVNYPNGARFADRGLHGQLCAALEALAAPAALAVLPSDDHSACVCHLRPIRFAAPDAIGWDTPRDGVLLLLAEAAYASIPGADLLRRLFDLTPAEARLAYRLVEGGTLAEAAATLGITEATARVHLRRVFAKTGVARQVELVRMLLGLGGPE